MPLTPEDVKTKEFTSTRLGRAGYDEAEVDDFLDEVEAELTRLYRENDELRTKLADAERALAKAVQDGRGASGPSTPAPAPTPVPPIPAAAQTPAQAAADILSLAQRTADDHIAEAKGQSERIVGEARTNADRIVGEAESKRRQVIGSLEHDRVTLERKIEELRAFEREYRSRLKSYLEAQLRELDGRPEAAAARPSPSSVESNGGVSAPSHCGGRHIG